MMPHTVPNSPMNGVMLAVVARNGTRCSSLVISTAVARSSARSTASRLLRVGRAGSRRPAWPASASVRAQLRVQLGIAGLEQPDQRAGRQRRADRLHLGELAALAEDAEEGRGLALGAPERPDLVKDDRPRRRREKISRMSRTSLPTGWRPRSAGRCRVRSMSPVPAGAAPAPPAQAQEGNSKQPSNETVPTAICVSTQAVDRS